MLALEHRARSFFLQCRASARYAYPRSCQVNRGTQRRTYITQLGSEGQEGNKPYYVTSPIFYVNSGKTRASEKAGRLLTLPSQLLTSVTYIRWC
jgi:hypothetical protein